MQAFDSVALSPQRAKIARRDPVAATCTQDDNAIYIELHAASAFSFLAGASLPEKLIERAVELEMPAIALADRNGVYGAARFHTAAQRCSVKAHIGAEIAVSSFGNRLTPPGWLPHQFPDEPPRVVLLCASQTGYQNLCQLITRFKMRETTKAEGAATVEDLEEFAGGLICLTGGDEGPLAAALARGGESEARKIADRLAANLWARQSVSRVAAAPGARRRVPQPGAAAAGHEHGIARDRDQRRAIRRWRKTARLLDVFTIDSPSYFAG